MVGLLDLAPVADTISIRGAEIPVYGLTLADIRDVMAVFPDVATLFTGGSTAGALLKSAPEAVLVMLAAGTRASEAERPVLATLYAGEQIAMLNKILKLTTPDGIGPFVELVQSLAAVQDQGRAPAATGKNKARAMSSPQPQPPSSEQDTASTM